MRAVTRWEYQDVVDLVVEQSRQAPEKLEERSKLAEHPFVTIKRAFNQGYFLLRGLVKVNGEMGFTALAYNFRRVLNILGVGCLMEAFREWLVKGRFSSVATVK
jgi:transposase